MKTLNKASVFLVFALLYAANSHATLYDRGGGLIYDSDLNVTWLQDADYVQNTYFSGDIQAVTWDVANSTVQNMTYANVSGWRLPHMGTSYTNPDNFNAYDQSPSNELAYMFYHNLQLDPYIDNNNYGELPADPDSVAIPTSEFTDIFTNLNYLGIWTDTPVDFGEGPSNAAWYFHFHFGQTHYDSGIQTVWAVHDGDVSAVPVPPALLLMGTGVLLMGLLGKKRRCATGGAI